TYFLISDGMAQSAEDTAWRLSSLASRAVSKTSTDAMIEAAASGLAGAERDRAAMQTLLDTLPTFLTIGGAEEGFYALYTRETTGSPLALAWSSDERAVLPGDPEREVVAGGRYPVRSRPHDRKVLAGLFTKADLGTYAWHLAVQLPDRSTGVMDVVYDPVREERTLDEARGPMVAISALALLISVIMMQVIMGWVLSLVDDLRAAADSVDAGQLDVRLPEHGSSEISRLAKSLNALLERLRKRADMQTRFVADASHELATPVAGIRGYVNILRDWGAEDPEVRAEAIEAIDRESRSMARLTSDLLSMIRSEVTLELKSERYDVNAAAREVLAAAATRYMDKRLEFVGPEEGPLWLIGDLEHTGEVLSILVDNACKYTPSGGRVQVTTRRQRDRIIVDVTDTGVGIPEQDLPNIFERFYRSDTSRTKEIEGFGLGLPIAKYIVHMSGGTLWVKSMAGSGTTFSVSLPREHAKET
ncbi:MAG TPA: HAMP domain-containing sensor histidine kinase, partial [Coriobacteriia bacterium]|nr:HAMP domain-containing sensor histidine kinase [Coriobacteriia bacterium]